MSSPALLGRQLVDECLASQPRANRSLSRASIVDHGPRVRVGPPTHENDGGSR
jgi:hypothetical protein